MAGGPRHHARGSRLPEMSRTILRCLIRQKAYQGWARSPLKTIRWTTLQARRVDDTRFHCALNIPGTSRRIVVARKYMPRMASGSYKISICGLARDTNAKTRLAEWLPDWPLHHRVTVTHAPRQNGNISQHRGIPQKYSGFGQPTLTGQPTTFVTCGHSERSWWITLYE